MKKLRVGIFISLAIMLMLTPLLGACAKEVAPPEKPIIMRFACAQPATDAAVVVMKELETIILEETDGRVKLEVYPGAQLYGNYDAPTQVGAGGLEICLGGCFLAPISPGWNAVSGLPLITEDYDHYLRFTKTDAFKTMVANLEAKGIKHITLYGTPGYAQWFNSKKNIEKLEDFKGLKLRVPPIPGMLYMCEALGIEAVSIPSQEVCSAIETGMIDGAYNPLLNLKPHGLLENCPYLTKCNLTIIPVDLVVSKVWWDSLPADIQQILERVLKEAGERVVGKFQEQEASLYAEFESVPGNILTEIKGEEKARWLELVKPAWEQAAAESEEARMVIEALESVR